MGRSVDSKEAGRVDSAPKSNNMADADAVEAAEGSIGATDKSEVAKSRRSP